MLATRTRRTGRASPRPARARALGAGCVERAEATTQPGDVPAQPAVSLGFRAHLGRRRKGPLAQGRSPGSARWHPTRATAPRHSAGVPPPPVVDGRRGRSAWRRGARAVRGRSPASNGTGRGPAPRYLEAPARRERVLVLGGQQIEGWARTQALAEPSRWRPPLPPGQVDVFASVPVPETGSCRISVRRNFVRRQRRQMERRGGQVGCRGGERPELLPQLIANY